MRQIKSELLHHPAFEHDSLSHQWVETMLDYNVPGGKLNRGLAVVETFVLLKTNGEREKFQFHKHEEEIKLAMALGWAIQWLVGSALVLDDVLDNSYTRRAQPCWYRLPNVGIIAVNDGVLLGNQINMILKKHFRERSYYVDLLELFHEAMFQLASGEMLDLLTLEKDFSTFTPSLHRRICKCKTAHGTFYLPFACALLLLGERLEEYDDVKELMLEMGIYFQAQDDYLDCYGDPEKVGKIGTDIEDCKCCWLVVKALELCNEEQRKVLDHNYGKSDPASVDAVKQVYTELKLKEVYANYENEMYEKLMAQIEAVPSRGVQAVLKSYLGKIHMRRK